MTATIKKPDMYKEAGIVIGMKKHGRGETITCIGKDVHTLTIGAMGSGKSRGLVIQSICTLGLAGEGIVVNDPKGELFHYTHRFLEALGYKVTVYDFQTPNKSMRYNLLQPIIDAVADGQMDAAQTASWDIVNILVPKSDKGEPIWTNGEMSVIAAAILCIVCDNVDKPQYQNLTNCYYFIANMCRDVNGITPIKAYVDKLPDSHPAKAVLGISNVAPSRTAGSFYTSALTTLKLFTARDIYAITSSSDFTLTGVGKGREALFFVLPDERTTYYPMESPRRCHIDTSWAAADDLGFVRRDYLRTIRAIAEQ